jgi:hypothetical protein
MDCMAVMPQPSANRSVWGKGSQYLSRNCLIYRKHYTLIGYTALQDRDMLKLSDIFTVTVLLARFGSLPYDTYSKVHTRIQLIYTASLNIVTSSRTAHHRHTRYAMPTHTHQPRRTAQTGWLLSFAFCLLFIDRQAVFLFDQNYDVNFNLTVTSPFFFAPATQNFAAERRRSHTCTCAM